MYNEIGKLAEFLFSGLKTGKTAIVDFNIVLSLTVFIIIIFIITKLSAVFLVKIIDKLVRNTKTIWDDCLKESLFFKRLSAVVPVVFAYIFIGEFTKSGSEIEDICRRIITAFFVLVCVQICAAFLDGVNLIYQREASETAKRKPLKGHIQLAKIFLYIVGAALAITSLLKVSPVGILSGIGAMSAVLLLVFKDSILGFVSSIQLSVNDMVRIGDWIEMPAYNADGNVTDITLQSVIVQNWDNTITSIPIYALVSSSFKNWRGMSESGGRRIKRAIRIDMRSVHFLSGEEIAEFSKISLIKNYMSTKLSEIDAANKKAGISEGDYVSGRRLTNLGTFRAYADAYIKSLDGLAKDLVNMVRYLEPDEMGIRMEIYLFSANKEWISYENFQADILDHLLASLKVFNLRVFQVLSDAHNPG